MADSGRAAADQVGQPPREVVHPAGHEGEAVLERAAPGISEGFNGRAVASNWSADPWARGSYAAFLPGQTTKYGLVAKRTEGGIHFAGEHTSTNYQGFLEGAVETGERAAREVQRELQT